LGNSSSTGSVAKVAPGVIRIYCALVLLDFLFGREGFTKV